MQQAQKKASLCGSLFSCAVLLNAVVMEQGYVSNNGWYALSALSLPFLAAATFLFTRRPL